MNKLNLPSLLLSLLLTVETSAAWSEQMTGADQAAGKKLVNEHCISCHAASFGGDGSAIYTRDPRKVNTAKGLVAQVRNCNTMLGLKWFEDEELNVAAYLNETYYKFTQ